VAQAMKAGQKKHQIGNRCLTIKTKKIMKKNLFMVAAVALMAMVSCNKEEIGNNGVEGGHASDIVFSAELEQPDGGAAVAPAAVQTKTSLGEAVNNVHPVTWNAGDKIKVNGVEFSATADGSRTDFTTTASFTEAATYYAVYPASAAGASDLTKVTIPASQNGTFAEAAISVAQSNTQSLHFKNVASILKFQVPAACSEVTIESTSNLAGTFPVTFDDKGLPVIGTVTNGSKKITVTGSFKTGTDYYVAVLSGTKEFFEVRIDGYLSKASANVNVSRAVISGMGTLPAAKVSTYRIIGGFNSWNNATTKFYDEGAYYVARGVNIGTSDFLLYNTDGDKYIKGPTNISQNNWEYVYGENNNNIKIGGSTSNAKYDVYLDKLVKRFYVTPAGSSAPTTYTLSIEITNNAWTNYNVYAWASFADNNYDGVWGSWGQCPSITTKKSGNTKYLYMRFPSFYNGEKVSFKLSNTNGSGESSEITNITLDANLTYKMNNTTLTKK